jgi:hypothetical protein
MIRLSKYLRMTATWNRIRIIFEGKLNWSWSSFKTALWISTQRVFESERQSCTGCDTRDTALRCAVAPPKLLQPQPIRIQLGRSSRHGLHGLQGQISAGCRLLARVDLLSRVRRLGTGASLKQPKMWDLYRRARTLWRRLRTLGFQHLPPPPNLAICLLGAPRLAGGSVHCKVWCTHELERRCGTQFVGEDPQEEQE